MPLFLLLFSFLFGFHSAIVNAHASAHEDITKLPESTYQYYVNHLDQIVRLDNRNGHETNLELSLDKNFLQYTFTLEERILNDGSSLVVAVDRFSKREVALVPSLLQRMHENQDQLVYEKITTPRYKLVKHKLQNGQEIFAIKSLRDKKIFHLSEQQYKNLVASFPEAQTNLDRMLKFIEKTKIFNNNNASEKALIALARANIFILSKLSPAHREKLIKKATCAFNTYTGFEGDLLSFLSYSGSPKQKLQMFKDLLLNHKLKISIMVKIMAVLGTLLVHAFIAFMSAITALTIIAILTTLTIVMAMISIVHLIAFLLLVVNIVLIVLSLTGVVGVTVSPLLLLVAAL